MLKEWPRIKITNNSSKWRVCVLELFLTARRLCVCLNSFYIWAASMIANRLFACSNILYVSWNSSWLHTVALFVQITCDFIDEHCLNVWAGTLPDYTQTLNVWAGILHDCTNTFHLLELFVTLCVTTLSTYELELFFTEHKLFTLAI